MDALNKSIQPFYIPYVPTYNYNYKMIAKQKIVFEITNTSQYGQKQK